MEQKNVPPEEQRPSGGEPSRVSMILILALLALLIMGVEKLLVWILGR